MTETIDESTEYSCTLSHLSNAHTNTKTIARKISCSKKNVLVMYDHKVSRRTIVVKKLLKSKYYRPLALLHREK